MEVIATGVIRLLRSHRAYYLVKDTTFALLEAEKMEKYINGRRYEYEDKTWLGRVKPMLSDCPATARGPGWGAAFDSCIVAIDGT